MAEVADIIFKQDPKDIFDVNEIQFKQDPKDIFNVTAAAKSLASSKPVGSASKAAKAKANLTVEGKAASLRKGLTRPISHIRRPWVVSCEHWMYGASPRFISLWVNPREISWSFPRRETATKTAAGVTRNVWRNRYRQTNFDEPTLDITFQAGSLLPSSALSEEDLRSMGGAYLSDPFPARGLMDFYQFMDLLNEPMLLGPNENRHILLYRSRVFPELRLEGYFTGDPVALTESATNANILTWTSKFQVYKSYPTLWQFSRTMAAYSNWASRNAIAEVLPLGIPSNPPDVDGLAKTNLHKELQTNPKPGKKLSKKAGLVVGGSVLDGKAVQRPFSVDPTAFDDPDSPWYNTTAGPQGELINDGFINPNVGTVA